MNALPPMPPRRPCPICGKPSVLKSEPFCSPRCAQIDLGRWMKEIYRVESDDPAEPDGRDGEA